MAGRIDKQIATEMGISLGTVRVYWKRIRMKVGGTRSEVIAELARTSLKLNYDDERSRSEQLARELEESVAREQRLRVYEFAFEHFPTPLAILDGPTGRIVRVNAAFASLHGYEADELEASDSNDLLEPKEVTVYTKQARAAARDGKHLNTETKRLRKDGTTFLRQIDLKGAGDAWVLSIEP